MSFSNLQTLNALNKSKHMYNKPDKFTRSHNKKHVPKQAYLTKYDNAEKNETAAQLLKNNDSMNKINYRHARQESMKQLNADLSKVSK